MPADELQTPKCSTAHACAPSGLNQVSGYLSDPEVFPSNFQNIHFYNVQSLIEKIRANSHFYNKVTPATMLPSLRNGTTIKCRPIHVYCFPSQLIFDPRSLSPVLTNTCKFKIYNLLPNSGWYKKPDPSILKKAWEEASDIYVLCFLMQATIQS